MNWMTNDNTLIISPHFNKLLDVEFISKYKNIIFSNFELKCELFEIYLCQNNNFTNLYYSRNTFN